MSGLPFWVWRDGALVESFFALHRAWWWVDAQADGAHYTITLLDEVQTRGAS